MELAQLVQQNNLRYVTDTDPGFRRARWGRGFTYYHPDGKRVSEQSLKERFSALVIPPAWEDVWICQYSNGHLQSTGRDSAERKQYLYHTLWPQIRNQRKFGRLPGFGEALPALRHQVAQDLGTKRHGRVQVIATAVRLLDESFIRIGNHQYTDKNGTYGLTTLEPQHVAVVGEKVELAFEGKSHVFHEVTVTDAKLAKRIRHMQELPGQRLFQYRDEDGAIHEIDSADVNSYLQTHMGDAYSAKDFRTWAGTVLMFHYLTKETDSITEGVRRVANVLGNTTAVCRDYYIHPRLFELHEAGKLRDFTGGRPRKGLSSEESSVLRLLSTD